MVLGEQRAVYAYTKEQTQGGEHRLGQQTEPIWSNTVGRGRLVFRSTMETPNFEGLHNGRRPYTTARDGDAGGTGHGSGQTDTPGFKAIPLGRQGARAGTLSELVALSGFTPRPLTRKAKRCGTPGK